MDPSLDLDDAFMKEILQIVSPATSDSRDSELSFNSESAGPPSSSLVNVQPKVTSVEHPSATAAAKPRLKRIRKGRKTELLELRAQVAAYKSKLDNLVRRKHDKSASKDGEFWERSAHRVALEERLAIRENARLRSLTERQLSTIKALQQSMLNIETSNHAELASPDERNPARITVSNRPVQLHRNSTDAIVGAPINAVTTPCKSARRVEMDLDVINGVRSVCFQLQDVHTIPFNYRVASGHAWKYLLQSHEHERRQGIYRNFQCEGNALFGVIMLDCGSSKLSCGVGGQVLLRKHMEKDSVSFVWETSPHACLSVLDAHKNGCIRFEPSPDDPSHAAVCITNVYFDPQPLGESGVGEAMKSVVSTYESTIGFLRQAVFTSLREQATSAA